MIIEMLDGRTVESDWLTLERSSYHVFWDDEDVTNLIKQSDKVKAFWNFDREKDNARASDEARARAGEGPIRPGSTSTLVNFVSQVVTDPFSAPLESADRLGDKIGGNSLYKLIRNALIVGLLVYLLIKFDAFKWLKKLATRARR